MKHKSIPFSPPDISDAEINEVIQTLKSGWITTGPRTRLLEKRLAAYIDTGRTDIDCEQADNRRRYRDRVACLGSATAAEEMNLRILGVRPGDEVIVPAYTYTSTASAVIHCGAKVVFIDIQKDGDPQTHMPELDYDQVEAAITEKTKAIVAVDLGGIVCDYDRLFEIVERKKCLFHPVEPDGTPLGDLASRIQKALGCVAVVADSAHSLGASRDVTVTGQGKLPGLTRKNCGQIAHFTSYSFHAVKNFTTAEGGAATWLPIDGVDDEEIYHMHQLLSLHGQSKDAFSKTEKGSWEYDVVGIWYKCNMTDIMAAIGLRQLDRYPELLEYRRDIIARYDQICDALGVDHLRHFADNGTSSGHLYLTRVPGIDDKTRRDIMMKLGEEGVSTNVHYKPLPMMTGYERLGWNIKDFPNSYDYYENLITLPLHTVLKHEDNSYVIEKFAEIVEEYL